jgi:hypothetical protein
MVDTDVMIDLFRGLPQAVLWFGKQEEQLVISTFVAMELLNGCQNRRDLSLIKQTLDTIKTVWLTVGHAKRARAIFEEHHLQNHIGIIDTFIGQTAVQEGLVLHTFNHKHYKVIPHIQLHRPYKR